MSHQRESQCQTNHLHNNQNNYIYRCHKEWESITSTSKSRDADGNTRYEGNNSLSHEKADKVLKPSVKKERKTTSWGYHRYNELLDFKNKVYMLL